MKLLVGADSTSSIKILLEADDRASRMLPFRIVVILSRLLSEKWLFLSLFTVLLKIHSSPAQRISFQSFSLYFCTYLNYCDGRILPAFSLDATCFSVLRYEKNAETMPIRFRQTRGGGAGSNKIMMPVFLRDFIKWKIHPHNWWWDVSWLKLMRWAFK